MKNNQIKKEVIDNLKKALISLALSEIDAGIMSQEIHIIADTINYLQN
jgi:hypothetical protein